jgi:hypothetical protein
MPASTADRPRYSSSVNDTYASTPKNERHDAAQEDGRGQDRASGESPLGREATDGRQSEHQAQQDQADRRTGLADGQSHGDEAGPGRDQQRVGQPASFRGGGIRFGRVGGVGRWHRSERPNRQETRRRDEGQQSQEDVPPAEDLAHHPGQGRPEDPGQDPGRRERGEHPRPEAFGQAPADRHVGDRRDRAGTEALDEPGHDEDFHAGRQSADQETDREQAEARRERPPEAATIDEPADHDDADQRPEEERGEDPAVELHPAELAGDDRHHRRDREGLERDQRDGQDQPERERPAARRPEPVIGTGIDSVHDT